MPAPPTVRKTAGLVLAADRVLEWLPPLLARLIVGAIFVRTGYGKITDLPDITKFFASLGIPSPHFNAVLASTAELVCGSLLIIGFLTRLAPIPLIITMLVALKTAVLPSLHFNGLGDYVQLLTHEEIHYIVIFIWLAIAGAGPVSVDHVLARWAGTEKA
jgi:putative oxidoreductase